MSRVLSMSLGFRLKKEREKRGWSQKYIAEKVGITNTVLSNYERDYRDPDTETLKKLADLYEVSIDYLLGRTDEKEISIEEKIDKALQLRDGEKIYFYDMEGLSDEDIEMLKKQIELYREMSEKRKKEKERRNKSEQG